jgi:hypothetical protein
LRASTAAARRQDDNLTDLAHVRAERKSTSAIEARRKFVADKLDWCEIDCNPRLKKYQHRMAMLAVPRHIARHIWFDDKNPRGFFESTGTVSDETLADELLIAERAVRRARSCFDTLLMRNSCRLPNRCCQIRLHSPCYRANTNQQNCHCHNNYCERRTCSSANTMDH